MADNGNEWDETIWESITGELRCLFLCPFVLVFGIPVLYLLIMVPMSLVMPIEWKSFLQMQMLLSVAVMILSLVLTWKILRVTINPDLFAVGRPAPLPRLVRTITAVVLMIIVRSFLQSEKENEHLYEKSSENSTNAVIAFEALEKIFIRMYLPWVLEIAFTINFERILKDVVLIIRIVINFIRTL